MQPQPQLARAKPPASTKAAHLNFWQSAFRVIASTSDLAELQKIFDKACATATAARAAGNAALEADLSDIAI